MPREIRDLIRMMSHNNPRRGAPRIHGELLKLGIEITEPTVAKYIVPTRNLDRRANPRGKARSNNVTCARTC